MSSSDTYTQLFSTVFPNSTSGRFCIGKKEQARRDLVPAILISVVLGYTIKNSAADNRASDIHVVMVRREAVPTTGLVINSVCAPTAIAALLHGWPECIDSTTQLDTTKITG